MPTTYIPRPDADFDSWVAHYYAAAKVWWLGHGLLFAELVPLQTALFAWQAAYPAHVTAQAAAESARAAKDTARRALIQQIRPITNRIQVFPATTDADRATIGITVRQPGGGGVAAPTTRPLVAVDTSQRLRHTIRFVDESTPTRRARPRGALGAEIRMGLVDAGSGGGGDPSGLTFLALATRGAAVAEFPQEAGGKTAVYVLRWVGRGGGAGPWSEACSATVAA